MTFLFGKSKDNFEASLKLGSNEEKNSVLQFIVHIIVV